MCQFFYVTRVLLYLDWASSLGYAALGREYTVTSVALVAALCWHRS